MNTGFDPGRWPLAAGLAPLRPSLLLLASLLTPAAPVPAADWPARQFQVQTREPVTLEKAEIQEEIDAGTGVLDSLFGAIGGEGDAHLQALAGQAEQWMNEIGGHFYRAGHEAPYIEPIVQDEGVPKYRVYMFPFTGSETRGGALASTGGGYQLSDCAGSSQINWVSYNADMFPAAGRLEKLQYWTFTHETFHALQYGDRLMAECFKGNLWIVEGMADGAGMHLTNSKWPNFSGRVSGSGTATGLRNYSWPLNFSTGRKNVGLHDLENKTSYLSSSFWRFFAENFGGAHLFPHFLDEVLPADADGDRLLKWLDERLRTEPNIQAGLYLAYPHFVTEFASYGGGRYTKFLNKRQGTGEAARKAWLDEAFTRCHDIVLTPDNPSQQIPISVMKVAAACIRVRLENFSGNVSERIEVIGPRLDVLDQLHLGWAWIDEPGKSRNCYREHKDRRTLWPPCLLKAFSQTGPSPGAYARTWPIDTVEVALSGAVVEETYILSNVAEQPWKTKPVEGYTFKVGVSFATANGEASEPVEQMTVPRKRQRPRNPAQPIGKEELYGLETDPPVENNPVKGLRFGPYTPNRKGGAKALPGGYGVAFNQLEYGKTGPVTGIVTREPASHEAGSGPVTSSLCADPAAPIGRVLESDQARLHIQVSADLCQAEPGNLEQCEGGCPVVDHLEAEVSIAFGWRQFGETAPTDIRTPGVLRYIETMPGSLEEAMTFGADTTIPNPDAAPEPGGADREGAGRPGGVLVQPCACTCEEREAIEAQAVAMKARVDAGETAPMDELASLTRCSKTCESEYMLCILQANREAREREREEKAARRQQYECDCSCAGIEAMFDRAREMQGEFGPGDKVPVDDLAELSYCSETCQQEIMECARQPSGD